MYYLLILTFQANSIKLGQEVKSRENVLEQCYARMERGQAPSDEIEEEWLNCLKNEIKKMKITQEKKKVQDFLKLLSCLKLFFF